MDLILTWLGGRAMRVRHGDVTAVLEADAAAAFDADLLTRALPAPPSAAGPATGGGAGRFVIEAPGEYEVRGVFIVGVPTPGPKSAPFNVAYALAFGDLVVGHLGHASGVPGDDEVADLGAIDVLVVPLGGEEPLDPSVAAEIVGELEPRVVVPIVVGADDAPLASFLGALGAGGVDPVDALRLTRAELGDDRRVVLLAQTPGSPAMPGTGDAAG